MLTDLSCEKESPLGTIPSDWKLVRLKDITLKIGSGATPRGGSSVYLDARENYALVRSQNVFDRSFDKTGLAYIRDEHAFGLRNVLLQSGDILLNITGDGVTFGRSCIVPDWVLPAVVNQHVSIIRINPELCETNYVLSYLTHPITKKYIESFNSGGSRRAVTKGHIESFLIPLPSLKDQKAIAKVLGALDDKIELNRQMNETLEAMAQAVFKSWFIDFDPVRANAEGRPLPGLAAELQGLFPKFFEPSALGDIPTGWRVGKLSDILGFKKQSINPGKFPTEKFAHFSLPAFDNGATPVIEEGNAISSNKYLIPETTVLISKLNPRIKRIWLPLLNKKYQSICSTEFLVGVPEQPYTHSYVYSLFHSQAFYESFECLVTGTSGSHQRVQPDAALNIDIILPSNEIIQTFSKTVEPMYERCLANHSESQTLAQLRDTLLPKLLNGEIRLTEAQAKVEALV